LNRQRGKQTFAATSTGLFTSFAEVTFKATVRDYRSREGAPPGMGFTPARKPVAAFMLDTIEQKKHFHKIVGIAK
jgi:hypothetical protein